MTKTTVRLKKGGKEDDVMGEGKDGRVGERFDDRRRRKGHSRASW